MVFCLHNYQLCKIGCEVRPNINRVGGAKIMHQANQQAHQQGLSERPTLIFSN